MELTYASGLAGDFNVACLAFLLCSYRGLPAVPRFVRVSFRASQKLFEANGSAAGFVKAKGVRLCESARPCTILGSYRPGPLEAPCKRLFLPALCPYRLLVRGLLKSGELFFRGQTAPLRAAGQANAISPPVKETMPFHPLRMPCVLRAGLPASLAGSPYHPCRPLFFRKAR